MINIINEEGLEFLKSVESNSIDLVLTDPPYVTSRDTGMNKLNEQIKSGNLQKKTEKQWSDFIESLDDNVKNRLTLKDKENYLRYGNRFGKRFAYSTDYGDWDKDFTLDELDCFIQEFHRVLKPTGTCIIFFDLWKITNLKDMYENHKFKQIRFIEWLKTNPVPINSKINYLTNSREIALTAVKKSKPTFNSSYDNGIYKYPIYSGKERFHPTQKSLGLFSDLVIKHTNENDTVLDCFLGSGTTAVACLENNRNFTGCERDETYYQKTMNRLKNRNIKLLSA